MNDPIETIKAAFICGYEAGYSEGGDAASDFEHGVSRPRITAEKVWKDLERMHFSTNSFKTAKLDPLEAESWSKVYL